MLAMTLPRAVIAGAGASRVGKAMTVEELIAKLRRMPREAELLALEPGCEEYCEREIDEVEPSSHRVYLHLGLHRDERHDQAADQR
jgi:hypothetical protein